MPVEMGKRVTSIVGAGAVLDFDFEDKTFPSTANITQKVVGQTIPGLDGEESDLIMCKCIALATLTEESEALNENASASLLRA